MFCRYGLAYVLHRLPAVANIIMTPEYLHFTQQIMASHDRANKQAEMDVSPAMTSRPLQWGGGGGAGGLRFQFSALDCSRALLGLNMCR